MLLKSKRILQATLPVLLVAAAGAAARDEAEPADHPSALMSAPETPASDTPALDTTASDTTTSETIETGDEPGLLDQVVPVADEEDADITADDAELATVPEAGFEAEELTDEDQLIREFQLYKELMANDILDEADNVAKRVVELAIRTKGPESRDTAKALTNLAIVQHKNREYIAAQQNFQQAVDILEESEDRLAAALINPLKGLGASQLEAGRPDLANRTLGRAVHISHVNEGPHNVQQIELLEALAESNLRLGEVEIAKDLYDTIYSINAREHHGNEFGMVPSLMRRAAWQHRAGYINDERATYRRIIRIIETRVGKDDLSLIEPLQMLGKSYFFADTSGTPSLSGTTPTTGEVYFKRALRIAEEHPDAGWRVKAEAKLALADYYLFGGNLSRARSSYRDAWDVMSADESRYEMRDEELGRVIALRQKPLPQYAGEAEPSLGPNANRDLLRGSVSYRYAITQRGKVSGLKIIEAQPPEFQSMQNAIQREMRSRLYRPRFQDGDPIMTPDIANTHTFYYRQADLEALRNPAGEDDTVNGSDNGSGNVRNLADTSPESGR